MTQPTGTAFLRNLGKDIQDAFVEKRSILSFQQWFELFEAEPAKQVRSVAQYLRDMFDHFGTTEVDTPTGPQRSFNLFTADFQENGGLVGHELVQNEVYKLINNFVRERAVSRLVLLHGPNGSAKSSFIRCIVRGLETYSRTEEGALYRFNWVFPTEKISRTFIGFGEQRAPGEQVLDTYALLPDLEIDAKISEELRDNPIFLVPLERRRALLLDRLGVESRNPEATEDNPFVLSDYIFEGDLSHNSKLIFDALLNGYHGDYAEVLKHVQIERFYISHRYRQSAVTIEPQLRVDAGSRQITVDRSLNALPSSLQDKTLFEAGGELVNGNRGIIEFADFLKRHPDLNRYLLAFIENGFVSVEHAIIAIDAFLCGSANEEFLEAFKGQPEYPSWKGRLDLIRMPYLLDYTVEQRIYDTMLERTELDKPLAPHTTSVAALWAVLTRLMKPTAERYPESIQEAVGELTPLQKALLYARNRSPEGLTPEQVREIRVNLEEIREEGADGRHYEGRHGISPREMKNLLLRAAQDDRFPCLSPISMLAAFEQVIKDPSIYPFLRVEPDGEYHEYEGLVAAVRSRYLDVLDTEIRGAMGLVDADSYEEYFSRYVSAVSHSLKGEKIRNKVTGTYEEPNENFLTEVERLLGVEGDVAEFRNDTISAVAAFRIDNPDGDLSYRVIFPEAFVALEESFYDSRREQVARIHQSLMEHFEGGTNLSTAEKAQVAATLRSMDEDYGYCETCTREVLSFLLRERYKD